MGDRLDVFETRMGTVDNTLAELVTQMRNQSLVITKLSEHMTQAKQKGSIQDGDSSNNSAQSGESRLAGKKVKLPLFDGEDPVAWITRAEIYFDVQGTIDEMKVKLARLSMEGSTIHWFNLLLETEDDLCWEKLKRSLIARYGGRRLENPFEELLTLKHSGSVEDFVESFELLSSQVGRLPEEQYLCYFMSGLKPPIRKRVRTLNPRTRMEMMLIAKDVEVELKEGDDEDERRNGKKLYERLGQRDWAGSQRYRSGSQIRDPNRSFISSGSSPNSKTGSHGSNSNSSASMLSSARKPDTNSRANTMEKWKGLRNDEIEERRAKGEGESLTEEGEIIKLDEAFEGSDEEEELEYSGASHCFISPKVTIDLVVTPITAKNIKLGDGHKVLTMGVCEGVKVNLGGVDIMVDAFVLELGGMDMVLGVSWLSTLGKVIMDWKNLIMQFEQDGGLITLQGLNQRNCRQGYLHSYLDNSQGKELWSLCCPQLQLTETINNNPEIPQNLVLLLDKFKEVFSDTIQLPPERSQVHRINLYPNHGDISVRPYRDLDEHQNHLQIALPVLLQNCFMANHAKCSFGTAQVEYLGHIISGDGVVVNPAKIQCILDWPKPKNVKGVRGFLGLTGYYRKFVQNYGKIAKPLTEMTKKDNFKWGVDADSAFAYMKKIMTSPLVLALPNFELPFEVECDAAGRGIGAVLMQNRHNPLPILVRHCLMLVKEIQDSPNAKPGFEVKQGVLLYHGRLVISLKSHSIPWLLEEFHNTPSGGHSGFLRTYRRLADSLYWVGMQKDVRNYVRACDVCQRQKYSATSPAGLLQPLHIPNNVWEDLSLDFITGLPKSKGYEAVLVVVDRLSKYSHFILLKHPYAAKSIAELFVKEVVRLHGIPNSIISGRDPLFVSHFWMELFKLQGTKLNMSSAYHPESDGQTEVINRCLEAYLRCVAADHPKHWPLLVGWAEFWYNTTFHVSIGQTPFEVVYGRKPPPLIRFASNETKVAAVAVELSERDEALRQLKLHLLRSQEKMASYANKKRRDLSFEVGEWVFLKLRPHRKQTVAKRMCQKLAARFFGPFQIVARVGAVAYKLQLPPRSKIHHVFHISLLKRVIGDYQVQGELPKELEMTTDNDIYPEQVVGTRVVLQGGTQVHQSLIQWKIKSMEDVTWEDTEVIRGQFPEFCLEDKTFLKETGVDRDAIVDVGLDDFGPKSRGWKYYYERKKTKGIKKNNDVALA
ncbi:hypothetical protein TSUD_272800 [Trifolium subterraneum]|uniref:Integrase catalytic domain-containing protein n=1 Tax=Trifolium subterraneum TaxID=3900 RepID=A0A1B5Z7G4_TRISU|nr:hypothetical protein TSUD_272800 [Trifolium subterraneum]